jgi:pimeloyl-ACP methyl ester carboxylesterase
MTENIAIFGEKQSLIGIVSEPESVPNSSDAPAVILLNSGLLHRVGPNRLYVKIARKLASAGFVAMRFDLSGIGDSQRAHNLPSVESAIKDTRHAMDFLLQTRDIRSFILLGICSGADNAFQTACDDPRVVGVTMMDGFAYDSPGYIFSAYLKLAFRMRSWRRLLTGKSDIWGRLKEMLISRGSNEPEEVDTFWPVPEHEQVIAGVNALAKRDVDLCLIYTSGGESHYNYKKTYAKIMQPLFKRKRIQVKVFEDTDHLFSPLHIQKSLIDVIHDWAIRVTTKQGVAAKSIE